MLDQATVMLAQATAYLHFDDLAKARELHDQALRVMNDASNCAATANKIPGPETEQWDRSWQQFKSQSNVYDSVYDAKASR